MEHFVAERCTATDEGKRRIFSFHDPKRASKHHFQPSPAVQSVSARVELVYWEKRTVVGCSMEHGTDIAKGHPKWSSEFGPLLKNQLPKFLEAVYGPGYSVSAG